MKNMSIYRLSSGDILEIIYESCDHQISQRVIKALKVTDTSIKAYCLSKRQFRTFKLDHILSMRALGKGIGA